MNKKILIAGLLVSVMLLVPINSAYSNNGIQIDNKPIIKTNPVNPTNVTFRKTYGGTAFDTGFFVQQTNDGGYIMTGYTNYSPPDGGDVWLIKTDSNGNMVWNRTFGGNYYDVGHCVQQTSDGGYILTGEKNALYSAGIGDVWLIKTDSTGNKLWDKTFGGTSYDCGYSVQQTSDDGYIITGEKDNDVWLIKTDSNGIIEWDKNLGGRSGYCVQQTTDGGYILTGETSGSSSNAVWLVKTDSDGNKLWDKTFEKCELENVGWYVQQTNDEGYIIVGRTAMFGKGSLWLIKTDSAGNKMWDRDFLDGYGYCVQQTTDGGYIISGEIRSFFGSVYLIKTDITGKEIWSKTFGGYGFFSGHCVQQTTDGGYIITGNSEKFYDDNGEDVLLIKTDKDGKPRDKTLTNSPLLRFFEQYPLLQSLLTRLGLQ